MSILIQILKVILDALLPAIFRALGRPNTVERIKVTPEDKELWDRLKKERDSFGGLE